MHACQDVYDNELMTIFIAGTANFTERASEQSCYMLVCLICW